MREKNIENKVWVNLFVLFRQILLFRFVRFCRLHDPKISTGAGDNFNAGFCAAQLLQLNLESSVILANAVSGYYVRTGTSAQLSGIINFLETIPASDL